MTMPLHSFYYSLMLCGLMSGLAFSFKEAAVASPTGDCSEVERDALLGFKANVKDPFQRLVSWSSQIDCCKWSGVVCKATNNTTLFGGYHVVELNLGNPYNDDEHALRGEILSPSLLNLTRLESLDLSWNDFEGAEIPQFIGSFLNLKYLVLSGFNISSPLPVEIWSLNHLILLDLSYNTMLTGLIPAEITNLNSLQSLFLKYCSFNGQIPSEIGNLTSLISLDLSFNSLSSFIPSEIGNLTSLISLYLSSNSLSDPIPPEIGNMTSLINLDLSSNSLSGLIPSEIGNLTSLINFYLSSNSLSGPIPIEIENLSKLQNLDLSHNSLVSVLTKPHLANLTNLNSLTLNDNSRITISSDWVPSSQLGRINFASCTVGPRFPQWLRSQKSMSVLLLSNTSINDILPHWFWNSSSSTFWFIDLSNNKLRGTMSSSLESMSRLGVLILSSNKLEGLVPRWPPQISTLDLSFNEFSGPIPSKISGPSHNLILSNNHIAGSIPSFICEWEQLIGLDLSYNKLSGEIPKCWQEANTNLCFIHLGNNKLTGEIPSSIGNLIGLKSLHLDNNDLSGQLPMSLQNCTQLHVIDLTGNNFLGSIPTWIGQSLKQLTVPILRSNMFSGIIPSNLEELSNLRILDLANNNLRGFIPHSFGNFSAIRSTSRETDDTISIGGSIPYYKYDYNFGENDSVSIVTKGYEYVFSSILYLVKLIDLSNNNLTGEFPTTLGSLVGLQTLNLSRNILKGKIPSTIGGMKSLETLDLSFNNLSGIIPQDLSKLMALNHLNLSYNNLSGNIPFGYQLQTLQDASIYMGNAHLCGALINKSCSDDAGNNVTKEELQKSKSQIFLSIYFGTSLGYVIGLWSVFIIILFKQNLYFYLIDRVFVKVHVPLYWRK